MAIILCIKIINITHYVILSITRTMNNIQVLCDVLFTPDETETRKRTLIATFWEKSASPTKYNRYA